MFLPTAHSATGGGENFCFFFLGSTGPGSMQGDLPLEQECHLAVSLDYGAEMCFCYYSALSAFSHPLLMTV